MSVVSDIEGIIEKGIEAVLPFNLINRSIIPVPNGIKVSDLVYTFSGKLNVFGFGKAAFGLVKQTVNILGSRIDNVVCCIPRPTNQEIADFPDLFSDCDIKFADQLKPKVHIFYGPRTNEPDEEVVRSSLMMGRIAAKMEADDLLLVCITGGGSALLTLPNSLDPCSSSLDLTTKRLSLRGIVDTTKLLSLNGATIQEINSVRSCLDCMKDGGLARFAAPARVVSLILSDVVGDPIRFIASGPTYLEMGSQNNISPYDKAIAIIDKYDLRNLIPAEVKNYLISHRGARKNALATEPTPSNIIIGNLSLALQAAAFEAGKLNPSRLCTHNNILSQDIFRRTPIEGFECILPIILTDQMDGDMTEKAEAIADLSWELRRLIRVFLRKPECTSRHVSKTMRDQLKAAQRRVLGKKSYYRDLIHACYQVANVSREYVPSEPNPNGQFLSGVCLLLGGEATVKVGSHSTSENPARGGRCSHAALVSALRWFGLHSDNSEQSSSHSPVLVRIGLFARASDGLDGPTAFGAGAWSTDTMIVDLEEAEVAKQCLISGDSYGYFERSRTDWEKGHMLRASLTGTNVMDLFMCLIGLYA